MTRKDAREQAFCLIFEMAASDVPLEEVIELASEYREFETNSFSISLAEGTITNLSELDCLIEKHCIRWKMNRVSKVALAILRLALYEMRYMEEVPLRVSINEAVELCKKYGSEEEYSFVNGVLGSIAREMEEAKA